MMTVCIALAGFFFECNVSAIGKGQTPYAIARQISLPLDSLTINIVDYLQYIPEENSLSFFNTHRNSIYFYSLDSRKLSGTIDLSDYGIKDKVQGYLIEPEYIYAYVYFKMILYRINRQTRNVETFRLPQKEVSFPKMLPAPFLLTVSPLKVIDGHIAVMSGCRAGENGYENGSNCPTFTFYDMATKKTRYDINYPKVYTKDNWGGNTLYRLPFFDVNGKNELVISFPASEDILVYSADGKSSAYPGRSGFVKKMAPYSKNKNVRRQQDKVFKWYLGNYSYEGMLYDSYRNVYYRVVRFPQQTEFNEKKGNCKPVGIMVFDSKFELLKEFRLDTSVDYNPLCIFVSPGGLCINVKTDNEDELFFHEIKIL